ncbi:helix-turn-helix transcriptional regulator [Nostoc sp. TCL240-02]|uniref:helix-turn-helix transcriptional regulator n=1 Tax=Nostoc sp. TCL240-02 TaxID=2572090 RepID=UPI00157F89A4|nr:AraC family transcriptional regulator [Nostoc sp. TCL240-02]QKQ75099.1 helix-turn-helix transcriptional regulator [Nostoc sp. TCL240-02]
MTINFTFYDFWDLRKAANQQLLVDPTHPEDYLNRYPKEMGKGYYRWICLREGMIIEILETHLPQSIKWITHAYHQNSLEFGFILAGDGQNFDGQPLKSGEDYIFGGVYPQSNKSVNGAGNLRWVSLCIQPETLLTLVESYGEPLPQDLEKAIAGVPDYFNLRPSLITPAKQIALQQILHCPYQGLTRKMYLESKVLELVSLKLADQVAAPTEKLLRLQEIDRIHHARDILLRNIGNPPSLIDLARQVGINEYTLKRGFRQIFGTTVFGYLHDYRMEQARQLLLSGQMKIEQIAQIVGYANRSHFATAFKKKYGINPKAYQIQKNI